MIANKTAFFFVFMMAVAFVSAQETEIGHWKDHVPYTKGNSVAGDGNLIYCASAAGFISYNDKNGEVKRYNTITGLSDIGVVMLKFNSMTNSLIVAYTNGNIDVLQGNKISNISAIKDDISGGDKSIINIRIDDKFAYLCTGFGIVVVDMDRIEIKDTYKLGQNSEDLQVNDVLIDHEKNLIYAATTEGVRFANLDDNLADFNVWKRIMTLPDPNGEYNHIEAWDGRLVLNYLTGVFDQDIVYVLTDTVADTLEAASFSGTNDFQLEQDRFIISKLYNVLIFKNGFEDPDIYYIYDEGYGMNPTMTIRQNDVYWMSDNFYGLAKFVDVGLFALIAPNGPNTTTINDADVSKSILWTTSGIMDPDYRGSGNIPEFNTYQDLEWTGMNRFNEGKLDSVYGYINVKVNPFDPSQVFMGSWDNGLMEIKDGEIVQSYTMDTKAETGHSLTPADGTGDLIRIGGMDFDQEGNLWITCSETPYALNVYKTDGSWQRFNLGSLVDKQTIVGELLVAENGFKWMVLNRSNTDNRIIVYDDNGTIENVFDDRFVALATNEGKGNIPGSILHCIEQDKSGAMWLGSNEGPAVFYSPDFVFQSQQNAQRILVQQDGQTQILLETENIKSIKTDGADRKWFATSNSGVYLMSSDATKQEAHFFKENSPLFSDEVNDIAINHENGEVFFCTSAGLISYKGTATEGGDNFGSIEVFPNPVRPEYSGPIAIRGLVENANVKITDMSGILVYETTANGGQAIWDGRTVQGNEVSNGVYLIFCTDQLGESQEVAKVLFLNH